MASVEDTLYKLSPDLPYQEWFLVISCIKSNLGESGFTLVNNWSSQSLKYKGESEVRKHFNSCETTFKGYGILINLLKRYGVDCNRLSIDEEQNRFLPERKVIDTKTGLKIWNASKVIRHQHQHDYLIEKKIQPYGCRLYKEDQLIIPVLNTQGVIMSVQKIYRTTNGKFKKLFVKNSRVKGNFFLFGEHLNESNNVYVCEGYATGASIYNQVESGVYCAFSKHNMISVVNNITPFVKSIVVMGDHDHDTDYLYRTFEPHNIEVRIPDEFGTDWNDYYER